ncbi:uncharacterized protein LOC119834197 isoform X2 [Zerene cesonia]|uniref:uncharacterized protein LOC119834197 isoform X2 n=1 Tax=Zerene cesonia TaxID=33412 RepID=UPI0018E5795E|nr:uncharacterized protein LOC119834197 isoform X2 [Zerene cesonia]
MSKKEDSSDSDSPIIDDNVIRIQLRKPTQRKWELRTRNLSPGIKFPTIQLFDSDGNLLVETNDENISIKSSDYDASTLKSTHSLRERNYKHFVYTCPIRKHNTISGDRIYTRIFKDSGSINNEKEEKNTNVAISDNIVPNIPNKLTVNRSVDSLDSNLDTTPFLSEGDVSSYKSSDNETCDDFNQQPYANCKSVKELEHKISSAVQPPSEINNKFPDLGEESSLIPGLQGSQSFTENITKERIKGYVDTVPRSQSGIIYKPPQNKVSFLNTYLKSVTARRGSNLDWFTLNRRQTNDSPQNLHEATKRSESPKLNSERSCRSFKSDNTTDNEYINIPSDVAADCELKKRLKLYRRGISEIAAKQQITSVLTKERRHSVNCTMRITRTSSSESVDEADIVLNRLKRRIMKNKWREKRLSGGIKQPPIDKNECKRSNSASSDWRDAGGGALVRSRLAMGSNISQHSAKGLKGRRARSSGDLCNGETKSQTESSIHTSVCGSVVGDVMGWNRSLPNHLDGNRHLADYSRVNNNYGEFGTYNRSHPKGGRGLRYRISKSGSDAEPVWKLQDPGFDQGYGSERSPEDDYVPPIPPAISLEEYEAELRAIYPFITDENTFTVVVEKDGRGLGMSVCGGGGLVRIRRLYPPQPAWRTGQLAPRDLLLSANGVPLAGLSTYEALEVLRTAAPRVELRVCRPPSDVLESITPPDPPTPPARTPHPPHLPLDPLNCHPLHARLSQTTSSATTSSSEGRGRRDASPDDRRHDLQLPDLDRPLPVYDIQYGEFDIVMTKVNGSLGFTLRKEDHSALGHYVRALVREPALSDGRIQPGDRIVAVNDTPMSNMSHAEAVAFLRACDSEVRLRLYRDHAATPLSPMSPKEEGPTDSDAPLNKPKPPLRAEAVSMLCDLAARRLTPDAADGSRSPCLSPRKFRKLTKDNNHYEQPNDLRRNIKIKETSTLVSTNAPKYSEDLKSELKENFPKCTCATSLPTLYTTQAKEIELSDDMIRILPDDIIIVPIRPPRKGGSRKTKEPVSTGKKSNKDQCITKEKELLVTKETDSKSNASNEIDSSPMETKGTKENSFRSSSIAQSQEIGPVDSNSSSSTKDFSQTVLRECIVPIKSGDVSNPLTQNKPTQGRVENYYENIAESPALNLGPKHQTDANSEIKSHTNDNPTKTCTEPITCTCAVTIEELKKYHKIKSAPSSSTKEEKKQVPLKLTENVENNTQNQHTPTIQRSKTQRFSRSHSIRKRLLSKRFKSKTISGPISLQKNSTVNNTPDYKSHPPESLKGKNLVPSEGAETIEKTTLQSVVNKPIERPTSLIISSNRDEAVLTDNMSSNPLTGIETKQKKPVLTSPTTPPSCRNQKLSLTVIPQSYELNNLDNDTLDAPNAYQEDPRQRYNEAVFPIDSDEPVSMPAELSSDERFKHSNPTYQSAVLHSSTADSASEKDDGNGLKKWKGVALSPDNERKVKLPVVETQAQPIPTELEPIQKENVKPEPPVEASSEPTIVTVELNRGWNSRLGFSVQSHPESGQSYISAVYDDSVAARDGRLRRGDVILQVNDENVTSMKTPEVIDLLRILRGSICITVLRPPNV